MFSYDSAKNLILQTYKNHIIDASFRLSDGYLFLPVPKDLAKDKYILGGYVKVGFNGEMSEYSAVANPEEFREALDNQIE